MNQWDVLLAVGEILAFCLMVIPPIVKLNTVITKLSVTVETVQNRFKEQIDKNAKSHDKIWDKEKEQDKQLADHERRIFLLENE